MHRIEIHRLDGTLWCWEYCDFRDEWHWVVGMLTGIYGCAREDIDIVEDEDRGDVLTVRGVEVGLLPAPSTLRRMTT